MFVDDPWIPLDNNSIERALRGPVVGRTNHYGSRSLRGTQVAALFYTLCETARLVGVDVHAYLLRALCAAMAEPGALTYPEDLPMSAPTTQREQSTGESENPRRIDGVRRGRGVREREPKIYSRELIDVIFE